jgi:hypothetical protein
MKIAIPRHVGKSLANFLSLSKFISLMTKMHINRIIKHTLTPTHVPSKHASI